MSLIMAFTPGSPRAPARSDGAEVAGPGRPEGEPARRHKDFPEQTLMKCTSLTERVSRGRESHRLTFVCSRTSSAERESANHHSRGPRKVKPTGMRGDAEMTSASSRYDVIVAGVGGMGSATAYHLARRGRKVLGLERYDVPHEMGSSHGITRIIRLAYYEHPSYVPLLRRAYELWRDLQQQAGEQLLFLTGSLDAGPAGSEVFEGSRASCEAHGLAHEVLTGTELNRRFPGYRLPAETRAVFQPEGGFLTPERCIVAHVRLAQAAGAEIHAREPVLDWEPLPG